MPQTEGAYVEVIECSAMNSEGGSDGTRLLALPTGRCRTGEEKTAKPDVARDWMHPDHRAESSRLRLCRAVPEGQYADTLDTHSRGPRPAVVCHLDAGRPGDQASIGFSLHDRQLWDHELRLCDRVPDPPWRDRFAAVETAAAPQTLTDD